MKISRGKINEYLATALDFLELGEVNITMITQIEETLKDFTKHDDTVKTSTTPA